MELRPHRIINRKKTKQIKVGNVLVGGGAKISVQSMTNTLTTDIKKTINQIKSLENAGADIVRVSCPDEESTKAGNASAVDDEASNAKDEDPKEPEEPEEPEESRSKRPRRAAAAKATKETTRKLTTI